MRRQTPKCYLHRLFAIDRAEPNELNLGVNASQSRLQNGCLPQMMGGGADGQMAEEVDL